MKKKGICDGENDDEDDDDSDDDGDDELGDGITFAVNEGDGGRFHVC